MKFKSSLGALALVVGISCSVKRDQVRFKTDLKDTNLVRGEVALCSAEAGFGTVRFSLSCLPRVREDFNLATALLHSFEYVEAEKVFARIIDNDPECLMAYWGAAMSNFHPLWAAPTKEELEKGLKVITLARSIGIQSSPESEYLEAIATIYDDWNKLDYHSRVLKFEEAAEKLYEKFPADKEAAVFYALALRAAADPSDKSFQKTDKSRRNFECHFPQRTQPSGDCSLPHSYLRLSGVG